MESGEATAETVRVLYVDGDDARRSSFPGSLTAVDGDFAVEAVDGADAALDRVGEDGVDCVVAAADPADGAAFDLLEEVRAADVAVPVVFFVADGSERFAARAVSADVDGYVSRSGREEPFERLADVIDDAVTGARDGGSAGDVEGEDEPLAARAADDSGAAAAAGLGASEGLAVCDTEGRIVFANDACASLFRTSVESLVGTELTATDLVDDAEDVDDLVAAGSRTLEVVFDADDRVTDASVVEDWTFDAASLVPERADEDEADPDGMDDDAADPDGTDDDAADTNGTDDDAADTNGTDADGADGDGTARSTERIVVDVTSRRVELAGETYVVFTCLDASERAELERDSSLLDAIFEFIPVYLYVKDREGRHVRVSAVNDEAQDYIGKTDVDLWGEDGKENYEEDMAVIEEGETVDNKEEFNPDWNQFFLTSKVPWRDEDGEIRGLIGTTRDLSEWKRHEQQLERQNERLRTVASVISHDIRNPLQVAKGRIDIARQRHESDNVDAAADALDRMAELLEELLDLVRHGQWVDDPQEVSLQSLAEGCWDTATGDAGTLEFEYDLNLSADAGRLQQLLENLFRNAVMHGGDDVTVKIGPLDNWSGFYVEDDGPGIPEDERDEIFESGYTTSEEGTGFGLAIVQVIAEAHGWHITVDESDAGGARFEFRGVEFV